jgi:hypothetical protein
MQAASDAAICLLSSPPVFLVLQHWSAAGLFGGVPAPYNPVDLKPATGLPNCQSAAAVPYAIPAAATFKLRRIHRDYY